MSQFCNIFVKCVFCCNIVMKLKSVNNNISVIGLLLRGSGHDFSRVGSVETNTIYTDALDCYDTPKMLILVFIDFRENQE